MNIVVVFLAVVALCSTISCIIHEAQTTSGTLRIDRSNPEKDLYRFEIDNIDQVAKKKRIVLKIDNNADLSQK